MIGEVFGNYRIVAELGAGGMGAVWLAEHLVLGSNAAVKVLLPELSQQQGVVQRFFDEARAATRIANPGIVAVLDFGWHPSGRAYLVMEHLAGETLTQRILRLGRVPPTTALGLARQCAIAMAAAHARGIVHRDLKPDNIFIVPDPAVAGERIKVLDFGIAKLLGQDASHAGTLSGMILGTPRYMSPEQARGAGDVDHRTDVYALGCVLFHMVCGRAPFMQTTPGDLIAAHLTLAPPTPSALAPGISPALDALVLRCLAKVPEERVQTMAQLVEGIDAVLGAGSTPTSAPTPTPTPTPTETAAAFAHALGPTLATGGGAAHPTTMGGESVARPTPAWRGGWGIAIVAVAALAGIVVVATRDRRDPGEGASAGAGAVREPGAGGDASSAAAAIDPLPPTVTGASPDAAPARATPDRRRRPGRTPGSATPSAATPGATGTGATGTGATGTGATGGGAYDPYADR